MAKTNVKKKDNGEDENKNKPIIDDLDLMPELTDSEDAAEISEIKKGGRKIEDDKASGDEGIVISQSKMVLIKKLLENIKESNEKLIQLLAGFISPEDEARISISQISNDDFSASEDGHKEKFEEGRIIEGVFDGENMIGPDGKQYSIPSNYASKSKLVEGDILKLTITPNGTFVYKQIGPIERIRLVGNLEQTSNGNFIVMADGKKLRVLTASVTYFKGQAGDEVVLLVPKTGESKWAAIENIVKQNQ